MGFARRPNPVFSPAYQRLRDTLITARRSAGLSQRDLAARIGKSPSHISRIELGERRVDLLEFHLIAVSLGADPQQLFRAATGGLDAPDAAPAPARRHG